MASRNRNHKSGSLGNAPPPFSKIQHPALAIDDAPPSANSKNRLNAGGLRKGYDPYDSGQLTKAVPSRRRDLRRLGEWLKSVKGKKN
jgi:hypothetical protein